MRFECEQVLYRQHGVKSNSIRDFLVQIYFLTIKLVIINITLLDRQADPKFGNILWYYVPYYFK